MNAISDEYTSTHVDGIVGGLAFSLAEIRTKVNLIENDLFLADTLPKAREQLKRVISINNDLTAALDEAELELTQIEEQFNANQDTDNG